MISTKNIIKDRILIIGSNGMLGQRLVDCYDFMNTEMLAASAEESSFIENVEYKQVDITNKKAVGELVKSFYPDVIINAAAFTAVDLCETEKELAWKVNAEGPKYLAFYAGAIDAHLIHISTDYVFNGKAGPYDENAPIDPINYYGKTKLAGENALRVSNARNTIIRTNVLYGPVKKGRPDFVKWVVQTLREGKRIRIVDDQINNPTFIDDLVSAIVKVIASKKLGVYHIGGNEFLNRFDFTMRIAEYFDLDKNLVDRIKTEELNQPAKRPLKSGLITLKAETEFGYKPHKIEETFAILKKELKL